jgi:hypothetical protein
VTFELTVDNAGEGFGFVYVSGFSGRATAHRHEIARLNKGKINLLGSGFADLGQATWT